MILDSGIDCLHWIWSHVGGTGKGVPTAKAKARAKGKKFKGKGSGGDGLDENARIFDPTATGYPLPVAGDGHIPSTVQYGGAGSNTLHVGAAALLDGTGAKVFAFTKVPGQIDIDDFDLDPAKLVQDPILHPGSSGVNKGLDPRSTGREPGRREWRLHIYYAPASVAKRMLAHNRQAVDHVLRENLTTTERARATLQSRKTALDRAVMKTRVCAARLPYVKSNEVRSLRLYLERKRDQPAAKPGRLSSDPARPLTAAGRPSSAFAARPSSAASTRPQNEARVEYTQEDAAAGNEEQIAGHEQEEYRTLIAELLERLLHAFCLLKNAPPDEATALALLSRYGEQASEGEAVPLSQASSTVGGAPENEQPGETGVSGAFNKPVFLLDNVDEVAPPSSSSSASPPTSVPASSSSSKVLGIGEFLVSSSVLGFLERHFLSHPSLDVATLERLQNVGALDPGAIALCKWIRFAYVFGTFAHEHRMAHARRVDSLIRHTRLAYHTATLLAHSRWHLATTHALLRGIVRWEETKQEKTKVEDQRMQHRKHMVEEAIRRDAAGALAMPKARVPDWTNDWFECLLKGKVGCGERHEQVVAGVGLSLAGSSSQLREIADEEEEEMLGEIAGGITSHAHVGLDFERPDFTKNGQVEHVRLLSDRPDDYDGEGPEGEAEDPTVDKNEDWAGEGFAGSNSAGGTQAGAEHSSALVLSSKLDTITADEVAANTVEKEMLEGEMLEAMDQLVDGDESKSKPSATFALCVLEPGAFVFRAALRRHRWTVRNGRRQHLLGGRNVPKKFGTSSPMSPSRSLLARTRKLDEEKETQQKAVVAEAKAKRKTRQQEDEDYDDFDDVEEIETPSSQNDKVSFAEARRRKKAQAEQVRQKAENDKRAEKRRALGKPVSRSVTTREWLRGSIHHLQGGSREPHACFVVDLLPRPPAGAEDDDSDEDTMDERVEEGSVSGSSRHTSVSDLTLAQHSEGGQRIIDDYLGAVGGNAAADRERVQIVAAGGSEWAESSERMAAQKVQRRAQRKWHQNRWFEQLRLGLVAFTFEFRQLPAAALDLITMQLGIKGALPSSQTFVERTILSMPRLPPPNASFNGYDNNSNGLSPQLFHYPPSITSGPCTRTWVEALSNDVDDWLEAHESTRRAAEEASSAAAKAAKAAVRGQAYALKQAAIRLQTVHLMWFRKRYDAVERRDVAEKEALKYKYKPAEESMDWKQQRAAETRRETAQHRLDLAKVPLPGVENGEGREMRIAAAAAAVEAASVAKSKPAKGMDEEGSDEDEQEAAKRAEAVKPFVPGWVPPACHMQQIEEVCKRWKQWPVAQLRTLATENEVGTMHCKNKSDIIRELIINGSDFPRDKKHKLFKKSVAESSTVPMTEAELEVAFGYPQPPYQHLQWEGYTEVDGPEMSSTLEILDVNMVEAGDGKAKEEEEKNQEEEKDYGDDLIAKAEAEAKAKAEKHAKEKILAEAKAEVEKKKFVHNVSGSWLIVEQTEEDVKAHMIAEGLIEEDHEEEEGEGGDEQKAKAKAKAELKLQLMVAVMAAKGAAASAAAISEAVLSMAKWPQLYGLLGLDVDETELGTSPQEFYRSDDIMTAYRQGCWTLESGRPLHAVHHEINAQAASITVEQQQQQLQQLRSQDKEKQRQSIIQEMDFTRTVDSRRRSSVVPQDGRRGPQIGMRELAWAISVLGSHKYRRAFHWMFKWRVRRVMMLLRRGRWPPPKTFDEDEDEDVDERVLKAIGGRKTSSSAGLHSLNSELGDDVAQLDSAGNPLTHGWYWNEHQFAGMDGDGEEKLPLAVINGRYDLADVVAGDEEELRQEKVAATAAKTAELQRAAKESNSASGRVKAAKARAEAAKAKEKAEAEAKKSVKAIGKKGAAKKKEKEPHPMFLQKRIKEAAEWAESLKDLEISPEGVFIESEDNDHLSVMVHGLKRPFPRTIEATWFAAGYVKLLEPHPWQQQEQIRARYLERQRRKRWAKQRRELEQQQLVLLQAGERTTVATRLRDSLPVMERRPQTPDGARAALNQMSPAQHNMDGAGGAGVGGTDVLVLNGDGSSEYTAITRLLIRRVDILHELENSRFTPSASPSELPFAPSLASVLAETAAGMAPGSQLHPALLALSPPSTPSRQVSYSPSGQLQQGELVLGFRHVGGDGGSALGAMQLSLGRDDAFACWTRHRMAADAMQLSLFNGLSEKWIGKQAGGQGGLLLRRRAEWRIPAQRVWLLPMAGADPVNARRMSFMGAQGLPMNDHQDHQDLLQQLELDRLKKKAGIAVDDDEDDANSAGGSVQLNLGSGSALVVPLKTLSEAEARAIVPKLPQTIAEKGLSAVLASEKNATQPDSGRRGSSCFFSPPPSVLTMVTLSAVEKSHARFAAEQQAAADRVKAEKAALKATKKSSAGSADGLGKKTVKAVTAAESVDAGAEKGAAKAVEGDTEVVLTRAQIAAKHMRLEEGDEFSPPETEEEEKDENYVFQKPTYKESDWAPEFGLASAPHLMGPLLAAMQALTRISADDLDNSPMLLALLHGCTYKRKQEAEKVAAVGRGILGGAVSEEARNDATVREEAEKVEEARQAAIHAHASIGVGHGMADAYSVSIRHQQLCRSWRGRRERRLKMRWDRQHQQKEDAPLPVANTAPVSFKVAGVGGRRGSVIHMQEDDGEGEEEDAEDPAAAAAAATAKAAVKSTLKYADALRRENLWARGEARMEADGVARAEALVDTKAKMLRKRWGGNTVRSLAAAGRSGRGGAGSGGVEVHDDSDNDGIDGGDETSMPPPPRPLALLMYGVHLALSCGLDNSTSCAEGGSRMKLAVPLAAPAPPSAWEQLDQAETKFVASTIMRKEKQHAVLEMAALKESELLLSPGAKSRTMGSPKRLNKRAEMGGEVEHFLGLDHEAQGGTHQSTAVFAAEAAAPALVTGAAPSLMKKVKTKAKFGAAAAATRAAANLLGGTKPAAPAGVHSTAKMYGTPGSGSAAASSGGLLDSEPMREAQAVVAAQVHVMASLQADEYEDSVRWRRDCHTAVLRAREMEATEAVWQQLRANLRDPRPPKKQPQQNEDGNGVAAGGKPDASEDAELSSFEQYARRESLGGQGAGGGSGDRGILCDGERAAIQRLEQRRAEMSFEDRELAEEVALKETPQPYHSEEDGVAGMAEDPVEGRPNEWEYTRRPARRTRYLVEVLQQMTRFNPLFLGYRHIHSNIGGEPASGSGKGGADGIASTGAKIAHSSEDEFSQSGSGDSLVGPLEILAMITKDPDIANRTPLEPFGVIAIAIRQWLLAVVAMRVAHDKSAKILQAEMHKLGAASALAQLQQQWWWEQQRYVQPQQPDSALSAGGWPSSRQSASQHRASTSLQAEPTSARPQEEWKPKEERREHLLRDFQAHLAAVQELLDTETNAKRR
jgi:hypothetical protein